MRLRSRLSGYALRHKNGRIEYFSRDWGNVGSYSQRKLREIPPGNFKLRGVRILAVKPRNRAKEAIAKVGIRHNILSFLRWSSLPRRFRPVLPSVGKYDASLVASNRRDLSDSRMSINSICINNISPIDSMPIIYTPPIISV